MGWFGRARLLAAALGCALGLLCAPLAAVADGSWIDQGGPNWNQAGMAVPAAPPEAAEPPSDPRCAASARWVENANDQAVANAGWHLYGWYESGWGISAVTGLSGFDGMCRPMGFQEFIFVDGVFAGTISPVPMDSRADGSGWVISIGPNEVTAQFNRYTPDDALCCPSAESTVHYTIDRDGGAPVLARTP